MRSIVTATAVLGIVAGWAPIAGAQITGFGEDGTGWILNHRSAVDVAAIASDVLTLTNNGALDANSAFFSTPQTITGFVASFTYQAGGSRTGDGAAFVIQNAPDGAASVGSPGGWLGYASLAPSAALVFNINSLYPRGTNYAAGARWPGYLDTSPVHLESGDPIQVTLTYNGTTLTETLVDLSTSATWTNSYAAQIVADVGGDTGFVGFTGGTGSGSSIQTIRNFSFQVTCGNGTFDPGEQCDATHDAACPGKCLTNCTCGGGGFVPPDSHTAKGENTVARNLAKLGSCVTKCQVKLADFALKGKPFDHGACEHGTGKPVSCRAAYDKANAALFAKGISPACLDAAAQTNIGDVMTTFLNNTNGQIYCARASSPNTFGIDVSGFVPPDKNTARCEASVARNLAKLGGCMTKCQIKRANFALKGKPFDEDACAAGTGKPVSCRAAYNKASAALFRPRRATLCPPCLNAAAQSGLADLLTNFVDGTAAPIYCAGTVPPG